MLPSVVCYILRGSTKLPKNIHYQEVMSILLVRRIDAISERQIFSSEHITRRLLRPRAPGAHRIAKLETPYDLAEFA